MAPHWPTGQPSFPRRPAPHNAGAGGEKIDRPKRASGSLRRGLACHLPPDPQPYDGRDMGTDHRRFATGKPSSWGHRQVRRHEPPAEETSGPDRPPPWGIGRGSGTTLRDAIQRHTLVLEGLGEAMPSPISMRLASKGSAIGWGFAPERSHAKLGTAGGEFA